MINSMGNVYYTFSKSTFFSLFRTYSQPCLMSSYKSANRSGEINRTNNKQAQQQQVPQKKMNRKDMDSACYRLSRVPQKYSMTKAVKSENSDSYAVTYYQSNPVDTRTMQ